MSELNKHYKNYDYISRYESFPYFYNKEDNRYVYGMSSNIKKSCAYTDYTVKPGDSYDSIALNLYGCSLFYWVICNFNDVFDCFDKPAVGTVLRIPALNSLSFEEV